VCFASFLHYEKAGVKNRNERLVVLNRVAMSIIDGQPDDYDPTAKLAHLVEATNEVSATDSRGPKMSILRRKTG